MTDRPPLSEAEIDALLAQNRLLLAQNDALRAALKTARDEIAALARRVGDEAP